MTKDLILGAAHPEFGFWRNRFEGDSSLTRDQKHRRGPGSPSSVRHADVTAGYDLGYHVYSLKESMAGYTQPLSEMMLHSGYILWSKVVRN